MDTSHPLDLLLPLCRQNTCLPLQHRFQLTEIRQPGVLTSVYAEPAVKLALASLLHITHVPVDPNTLARDFLSLVCALGFGFIRTPRNCGGRPYRSMLSVKSRTAQVWIQALKACINRDLHMTAI